jgi:pimeloyl-ACP methyl ester carboxylesterase
MSLPGRFLDIGGQRVFYHRTGRGRTLVLIHGFLLSHFAWRHVIPGLAAEHDVIAIDLPGFGESDRPTPADFRYDAAGYLDIVIGVLDALGLERATLVGHGMGGGIALHTAARQPDRVDRLVVVAPLAYPSRVPMEGRVLLVPFFGPAMFSTFYTRGLVRRYMIKDIYLDPSLATDEWVDYIWERVNRPGGMEAAQAAIRFCADPSAISRNLRAVRAPTLIAWGERDILVPPAHAERLEGDIAGSRTVLIPSCGHAPAEERPAELLRHVIQFLEERESPRRAIAAVPA